MGKNCADRRCISEWDSFIATQAYSTLCKSKTMKRWNQEADKKHWQMKRVILSDINMALNHITGGLEYKHTYTPLSLSLLFSCVSSSTPPFTLPCLTWPLSALFSILLYNPSRSCSLAAIQSLQCFPEDLTLWCYCARAMILTLPRTHENYHSPRWCCQTYRH